MPLEGGHGCPRCSRLATVYRSCLSQLGAATWYFCFQNLNATVINRSSASSSWQHRGATGQATVRRGYRIIVKRVGMCPQTVGLRSLPQSRGKSSAPRQVGRYLPNTWVHARLHLSEISMHETVRQAERENIPESPRMMRFPWNIRITVVGNAALVWVPQRSPAHGPRRTARHSTESTE